MSYEPCYMDPQETRGDDRRAIGAFLLALLVPLGAGFLIGAAVGLAIGILTRGFR